MSNGIHDGATGPAHNRTARTRRGDDASGDTTGDPATRREKTKFGEFMTDVGHAALQTVATVAPVVPGGQLLEDAATTGLQGLQNGAPGGLAGGNLKGDQLDKMWQMQEQNQVYNMQYLDLQQHMQRDNRHFKTLSNLMKVRHDTAKSAIDNMRA
jgi:hypothetical protein